MDFGLVALIADCEMLVRIVEVKGMSAEDRALRLWILDFGSRIVRTSRTEEKDRSWVVERV